MSTLYKRKLSPYWWWSALYKGRRFAKSTKMKNKSYARKVQQKWDFNLILDELDFLGLRSNPNCYLKPYSLEYLSFLEKRKRAHAVTVARGVLNNFIQFTDTMKVNRLGDITVKVLDGYIDSLDRAPKTKKNHLQVISSMMTQSVKEGILKSNPCELATLPEMTKKNKHRLLEPTDLEIIFNGSGSWYMYYSFLYHTGLRAGDVALLKLGNIDFKKKAIVSFVRKNRQIHEFPIADVLLKMLDKDMDKNEPLFPTLFTENERTLNGNLAMPRKFMQSLLKSGSRSKATLHSFRHTFNTALRDLGLQIEDRQILLAHASSETNKIYTHPNFDLASQYVNRIPMFKQSNRN